jgi:DNA-binding response OmpR family regulator
MEKPIRILAVDNEPSVTSSIRYVFDGPRYQVNTIESSEAALDVMASEPQRFDVLIVDQKMPNLTGAELVGHIKTRGLGIKVIVLSANLTSEVRATYESLGVEFIFTKPFNIGELRSAVNQLAA